MGVFFLHNCLRCFEIANVSHMRIIIKWSKLHAISGRFLGISYLKQEKIKKNLKNYKKRKKL